MNVNNVFVSDGSGGLGLALEALASRPAGRQLRRPTILFATTRSRDVSRALTTMPMPPRPTTCKTS